MSAHKMTAKQLIAFIKSMHYCAQQQMNLFLLSYVCLWFIYVRC